MSSYQELQQQIKKLQAEAEAARKVELAAAREKILAIMNEYGLTIADLAGAKVKPLKGTKTVPAKYRDEATGQSWTGRGRAPKWIEGKAKEQFLIK